jgi:membrane-associated protease RseP (regulator of RpoE activity)
VSTNGPSFLPPFRVADSPPDGGMFAFTEEFHARPRQRYWLHALLLLLTLLTTTVVGTGLAISFQRNLPFNFEGEFGGYRQAWHHPSYLLPGLPFSLTLLTILLAHEFGHYIAARYYRVDVTLPFFLPAPTLIGTLGAFIRIRSAIVSKRILFDIGIAGPLAGFAVLLVPLVAGVAMSKVIPGIGHHGFLAFGTPLILRLAEWIRFPGVPATDIYLHPVARAAWVGALTTALNLLPIGQLDGGHILYAFVGERTKYLSRIFVLALASLGGYQLFTTAYSTGYTWLFWSALLLAFAMRHPAIIDPHPMTRGRTWLAVVALIVFVLSFTLVPVRSIGP